MFATASSQVALIRGDVVGHITLQRSWDALQCIAEEHGKRLGRHESESQGEFPPDLWRTFLSKRVLQLHNKVREVMELQPLEIFVTRLVWP